MRPDITNRLSGGSASGFSSVFQIRLEQELRDEELLASKGGCRILRQARDNLPRSGAEVVAGEKGGVERGTLRGNNKSKQQGKELVGRAFQVESWSRQMCERMMPSRRERRLGGGGEEV
jgi:hypothetical protein